MHSLSSGPKVKETLKPSSSQINVYSVRNCFDNSALVMQCVNSKGKNMHQRCQCVDIHISYTIMYIACMPCINYDTDDARMRECSCGVTGNVRLGEENPNHCSDKDSVWTPLSTNGK